MQSLGPQRLPDCRLTRYWVALVLRALARETLLEAQVQDPDNSYIKNNLELLEASVRKTKAVQ